MSPQLIGHFRNPRNVGELPPPALVIEVSNPVCGDILRLTAEVTAGRLSQVLYKVRGCAAAIACGSALTELLLNNSAVCHVVSKEDIERAVGGLSNESKHAAALCADAANALLKTISSSPQAQSPNTAESCN